ncbi:MAG: hypothetical protein IJF83_10880 [Methanobrevibacter sp.]|nr:hypothetical protein [Methanobrevibacter sp.]
MTEQRFQYIRGEYKHGIQDTVKDGKHRKGYRTTYDEFDLDKLTDELNIRENRIKQLEKENEQLKKQIAKDFNQSNCITVQKSKIMDLEKENEQLKQRVKQLEDNIVNKIKIISGDVE